jgi:hypothetical protein
MSVPLRREEPSGQRLNDRQTQRHAVAAGGAPSFREFPRLGLRPSADADAPIAVIFPPWWSAERAFTAAASAGGAIVREGAWSNILVVKSTDAGFVERLHAAGAWLLLNPQALAACLKEGT